jgi:hypothetical protein
LYFLKSASASATSAAIASSLSRKMLDPLDRVMQ